MPLGGIKRAPSVFAMNNFGGATLSVGQHQEFSTSGTLCEKFTAFEVAERQHCAWTSIVPVTVRRCLGIVCDGN
eukprot:1247179-Amphidinium_carterae.1